MRLRGFDPPRELLLICTLHQLEGGRAPRFSLHTAREHPRLRRPRGSLKFRVTSFSWPCGRAAGGGPGTAVPSSPPGGVFWGKTNGPRGWAGGTGTLQLRRPRRRWVCPGVRLQTKKPRRKAESRALRCPPARRRLLAAPPLLDGFLAGGGRGGWI